ncbi:MAG: capsule assembly Wzi family protein, partial [Armatimonadota bacterium]|nr:capsule assembly Wzi family protein [Armatimonadota bacterium]
RVPLGDWSYDAMISLASDGLIPGYAARVFEGDRLFNRMEMAAIGALIMKTSESRTLSAAQIMLIDDLIQEFTPELLAQDKDFVGRWKDRSANINSSTGGDVLGMGYVKGLGIARTREDSEFEAPFRLSGFAKISPRAFATVTLAQKEEKFYHDMRQSPTPDKAFVKGFNGNFVWSLGREYLNWGPSYTGSLILSDNSSPFIQARGVREIDLGWFIGRIKITEFGSMLEEGGDNLYLFGRRYEKPISKSWHFGISETVKTSKVPNPAILVLPFFLYQHIFNGPGSETDVSFNTLYSADLLYQMQGGAQIYGDYLVDDMSSPKIFGRRFDRPNKRGYTLGFYAPKALPGEHLSTFRAEYIRINRQTYEATRSDHPELAYTHGGDIIGSAIGPNAEAIYLRGEHYLSDKWSLIGEYLNHRQKDPGEPASPHTRSFSLLAAYDIAPDKSVGLRISSFRESPPGESAQSGTGYEVRASFAF